MPRVYLGNPYPIFNGRPVRDDTAMTRVDIPENKTIDQMVRDVSHDDGSSNTGLWVAHSAANAPSWVVCDENPELAQALADKFGCPVGRPQEGI